MEYRKNAQNYAWRRASKRLGLFTKTLKHLTNATCKYSPQYFCGEACDCRDRERYHGSPPHEFRIDRMTQTQGHSPNENQREAESMGRHGDQSFQATKSTDGQQKTHPDEVNSQTIHSSNVADKSKSPFLPPIHTAKPWPEDRLTGDHDLQRCLGSFPSSLWKTFQRWTYAYMQPILLKGQRQFREKDHLTVEDVYVIPADMQASVLVEQFWDDYHRTKKLVPVLFRLIQPIFVPAGFWELLVVLAKVSLPLSLRQILLVLEANPSASVISEGLPFAITLSLAGVVLALSQNRVVFLCTASGIRIRAALTTALYEHALRLTASGKIGLTTGQVTNLVAVDTQKLFDVCVEGHNLWSCPLLIIIVLALLATLIGTELMIGVLVLILFIPIVRWIVQQMLEIRKARSALTDVRINTLTAMLHGIHVTKLNHYERNIESQVETIRRQEMVLLRKELWMWGWVLTTAVCSPLVAVMVAFSFYTLLDEGNLLTPSTAFSTLLLFSILRSPINMAARLVGNMSQAVENVSRITLFLEREAHLAVDEEASNETVKTLVKTSKRAFPKRQLVRFSASRDNLVSIEAGCFSIKPQNSIIQGSFLASFRGLTPERSLGKGDFTAGVKGFSVSNLSFEVKRSEVIAVVGKVGSGKSLLLRALLGEVPTFFGDRIFVSGRSSYAAQQAFILNASLRENILFGKDYNEQLYKRVLKACCLTADIQWLGPAGDLTQIGERGVTLSGGQKQRVALARAVYTDPDLAFLDDCFSALDPSTANAVYEGLFGLTQGEGRNGILRSAGTILVTHSIQFLSRVDKILVLSDGAPSFFGTWAELQLFQGSKGNLIESIQQNCQEVEKKSRSGELEEGQTANEGGLIMTVEERKYGGASFSVWTRWFSSAGGWSFFLSQMILSIVENGLFVSSDWWVAKWSDSTFTGTELFGMSFPPQTEGRSVQVQYAVVHLLIVVLSVFATSIQLQFAVAGGAKCAERMFLDMTTRVLRAPSSYFETTPLGRVLNRFTYDVEVLDVELSISMAGLMISSSLLISSIVVMLAILPWIALYIMPVGVAYTCIQLYYRRSGPDLQRIDATSRSPIQAKLAEGMDGATTIRAFHQEKPFIVGFQRNVDFNSSAMLNFAAAQRWLAFRMEILGATVGFVFSTIVICTNDRLKIDSGMVGLALQWATIFSAALNFFFLRLTEAEAKITSIERVHQTTLLPQEASWETDPLMNLDKNWPKTGILQFDSVCMRYRSDLPLALKNVSFQLAHGMRCGIVGRTGSGKTSLTASLFRLVEIEAGQIVLDGIDLSKVGLADVRGRRNGMQIIPQDPVLFAGILRECLDPFFLESDEKVLQALQAVNHKGVNERGKAVLNDPVDEGGSNYSVGERQLLCLARAIVQEPRVLVLDEATASVDAATDAFIQDMLRTRFKNTTLLTIAHRLNTIMDYDMVIVLDDGHCVETGSPLSLLADPDGWFTALVDASGPNIAAELRRIAAEKEP